MDGGQVGDLVIFIFCTLLYLGYHLFYFVDGTVRIPGLPPRAALWSITKINRAAWTEDMMSDPKEAILAVQTVRNSVTGVSILSAVLAALASALLNIITDPAKLAQVAKFSDQDPITGGTGLFSPEVKLGLNLGALFLSLLSFSYSIRLAIHLGYMVRVVPKNSTRALRKQCVKVSERSALYFAIGLRCLYAFLPLSMWLLGSLALLITTIVLVVVMLFLDFVPAGEGYEREEEEEEEEREQNGGAGSTGGAAAAAAGGHGKAAPDDRQAQQLGDNSLAQLAAGF